MSPLNWRWLYQPSILAHRIFFVPWTIKTYIPINKRLVSNGTVFVQYVPSGNVTIKLSNTVTSNEQNGKGNCMIHHCTNDPSNETITHWSDRSFLDIESMILPLSLSDSNTTSTSKPNVRYWGMWTEGWFTVTIRFWDCRKYKL